MSDAADGYLGDWLPHKESCRCVDCRCDRAEYRVAELEAENTRLRECADAMPDEEEIQRLIRRYMGFTGLATPSRGNDLSKVKATKINPDWAFGFRCGWNSLKDAAFPREEAKS